MEQDHKKNEIDRLIDILICSAMSASRGGCPGEVLKIKESVTRALYRVAGVSSSKEERDG